jgi:hypothetical protein
MAFFRCHLSLILLWFDVSISPLTEYLDLGETLKGDDQQEGELGLDGEVGDFGYTKVVQCAKDIYPILEITCGGNDKKLLDLLIVLA